MEFHQLAEDHNFISLSLFILSSNGGCVLNRLVSPFAEKGFSMNSGLVALFPSFIGLRLISVCSFSNALANASGFFVSCAEYISAKYSLDRDIASCSTAAIIGVIIAITNSEIRFPPFSLFLLPPNIVVNLAIAAI